MVFFNYALRKLNAKIVYYGPGLCGKTTNLQWVHDHFEGGEKGKMVSLATEGDRTIFFDLLPLEIGKIRGMDVTLQLYTVPGQVHYNSTRQLVLRGADGVVFVADSQSTMQTSNVDSLRNLEENLSLQGIELKNFPHILQFNKRDLRNLLSIEDMNSNLNRFAAPIFEAVAVDGIGVQESLEGIVKLVMRSLKERYEARDMGAGAAARPVAQPSPAPAPSPPPAQSAPVSPPVQSAPVQPPVQSAPVPPPAAPQVQRPPAVAAATPQSHPAEDTHVYSFGQPATDEGGAVGGPAAWNANDVTGRSADTEASVPKAPPAEPPVAPESAATIDPANDITAVDMSPPYRGGGEPVSPVEPSEEEIDTHTGILVPDEIHDDEPIPLDLEDEAIELEPVFDDPGPAFAPATPPRPAAPPARTAEPAAPKAKPPTAQVQPPAAQVKPPAARVEPPAPRVKAPAPQVKPPTPQAKPPVRKAPPAAQVAPPAGAGTPVEPPLDKTPPGSFTTADIRTKAAPAAPPAAQPPAAHSKEVDDLLSSVLEAPKAPRAGTPPAPKPAAPAPQAPAPQAPAPQAPAPQAQAPSTPAPPIEKPPVHEPPAPVPPVEAPVDPFSVGQSPQETVELRRAEPETVEEADPFAVPPREVVSGGSEQGVLGDDGPFGAVGPIEPELIQPEEATVADPSGVEVTAGSNSLALKLSGTGAIVESGQVRALDIEVPVPGAWVGNQKVTLQLRLTLAPVAEDEDE